jgi:hypothetical protein
VHEWIGRIEALADSLGAGRVVGVTIHAAGDGCP